MDYDTFIIVMRYVYRFLFLYSFAACGVFAYVTNNPLIKSLFYRLAIYFGAWFLVGSLVLEIDYAYLAGWQFIGSLLFNCLMMFGFATLILKKAYDWRRYQRIEPSKRPSDAILKLIDKYSNNVSS